MKSSPPDRSFAGFVRRALDAIATEVPWAHEGMAKALGARAALIVSDGEPARVHAGHAGGLVVDGDHDGADVACVTTSRAILGLVSGRDTLLDAVESERLHLTGSVESLLAWHDLLELFLHGAVRARAFEGLLREFRRKAENMGSRG